EHHHQHRPPFHSGVSEDSDYTSDVSFPIQQQQPNSSVHQFDSHLRPYRNREHAAEQRNGAQHRQYAANQYDEHPDYYPSTSNGVSHYGALGYDEAEEGAHPQSSHSTKGYDGLASPTDGQPPYDEYMYYNGHGNYTPEPASGRVSRENMGPSDGYDYAPYSSGPTYNDTPPNNYDGYRSPPLSPPYIPPSNYRPASVSSRSTPREEYTPYDQVVPSTSGEPQQPYQPRYESPRRQRGNVSRQRSRTLVDSDEFDVEMEDYSSPTSAGPARNDRRSNHVASPARSGSRNRRYYDSESDEYGYQKPPSPHRNYQPYLAGSRQNSSTTIERYYDSESDAAARAGYRYDSASDYPSTVEERLPPLRALQSTSPSLPNGSSTAQSAQDPANDFDAAAYAAQLAAAGRRYDSRPTYDDYSDSYGTAGTGDDSAKYSIPKSVVLRRGSSAQRYTTPTPTRDIVPPLDELHRRQSTVNSSLAKHSGGASDTELYHNECYTDLPPEEEPGRYDEDEPLSYNSRPPLTNSFTRQPESLEATE
ncbi:Protein UNC-13 a, partial [Aphelenchoides avenae]